MGNIRRNLLNHLNELGWMPQEYSSKEDIGTVTAIGDVVAPATPENLVASNGTERIKVEWDEVTKDVDGSDNNDLDVYRVYYVKDSNYSDPIDPDDDSTYDGYEPRQTLSWSQEVPVGEKRHYAVTAVDETGNESPASNEGSATSQAVSVSPDVSDYADNFDEVLVGDGIIGLVFRQPDSGWSGYSHYKLYRDELSGSSWTKIFEGSNPAYIDKDVNEGTLYKYKLSFVDVDGGETDGTVRDNSDNGYNPNRDDNSNITGNTFLAQNIVAVNEVRGDSLYAESQIVLGGVDDTGYIKSSNYDPGVDGFKIDASGSAEFNDVTVRGSVTITGGSGIGNLTDAGGLAEKDDADWSADVTGTDKPEDNATLGADWNTNVSNIPDRHTDSATTGLNLTSSYLGFYDGVSWKAYINNSGVAEFKNDLTVGDPATSNYMQYDVSAGALTVRGDITADSIITDGGDVKLGDGVLPGGGDGLYIAEGGGIQVTDSAGNTIFNSDGEFGAQPAVYSAGSRVYEGNPSAGHHTINVANEVTSLKSKSYLLFLRVQLQESGYSRTSFFSGTADRSVPSTGETRGASIIDVNTEMEGIGHVVINTDSSSRFSFRSKDYTTISLWVEAAVPLELG